MTATIDNVIFDIGNVLIKWNPDRLYRKIFASDAAMLAFYAETGLLKRNIEFDRGEPFADGIADLTARFPNHAEAICAFDTRWEECLDGAFEDSVTLLAALRKNGLPNYAITNFSREKFDITLSRFPFLGLFDDTVVSADVRMVKPDPQIFRILLDRQQLDPTRTLFIDDSAVNIATATSLGLITHHFVDPAALRRDFTAYGLPVGAAT